ncbi:GL16991 [Drosophila persimilis]|uniref:Protein-lysine N-methyltransferase SMYD4 n=2 Tax=pseudoobscura subgroup TaxID=32358 RepID=A0A6I8UVT0_DROPS|nr:SET and MYND domain-containing protein 4 [Drosophila pseudoobscura]XP_002018017.1 SET and MYND domain-containing protein 4 [Drosophila persimilis]EDW35856.1 GL16991 [Drosophila persimilis]
MDVYDVSDDLVKKLNDWKLIGIISGKFNELKENYSKVNFVEHALIDFKYMEKIFLNVTLREDKCNKRSVEFRMLGNEQFSLKNRKYFQALELYNKSICFAEPNSEHLSIGYANRSAVLFEWKRYRDCLANIELARKANYPARLSHKLDKRERDCQQLLEQQPPDVVPHEFKLSFDSHAQVPYIADCLELRESPDEGRFVVTNRDLVVGDLVAVEQPFCSTLLPPMRYIRCATCKRENYLTLIPCDSCCSVMFCSEECKLRATSSFHRFECPIIDFLHRMFNKIHGIALRTTMAALDLYPSIEELMAFCEQPQNQHKCAFDLDYSQLSAQEHYRAIHGLVTNQHLRSVSDLFQRSVVCAVLKHFIIEYTPLKDFLGGEDGRNFFTDLLFRHLQTSPSNMHGIDLVEQVNETKDDQTHSSGAYAFLSLLNHSCAPNTLRIYEGTKAYLFVLRPIKAGNVLYDNYGAHFAVFSKQQRLDTLSMQYRFDCKCEGCELDYPTFGRMPHKATVPSVTDDTDMKSLGAYNYDFATSNYTKYCEFLTQYGAAYPCEQISSAEECLKMALHIMVDAVPLKAKM